MVFDFVLLALALYLVSLVRAYNKIHVSQVAAVSEAEKEPEYSDNSWCSARYWSYSCDLAVHVNGPRDGLCNKKGCPYTRIALLACSIPRIDIELAARCSESAVYSERINELPGCIC